MAVDNNNLPIRLEHLCGDGGWVSALKKAEENPFALFERIKDDASKAFFSIQPNGSFQPYSKIKQLLSEPFVTFVERLTRAIELQVKNKGAQEQVLDEMALADAIERCKAAVLSLSMELAPALHDMLQHLDHNGYRVNGLGQQRKKRKKKSMDHQVLAETAVAETTGQQCPPDRGWVVACVFDRQGPLGSLELSQDLHEWQEKLCPQCQEVIVIEVSCGVCGARFERETPKLWHEGGLCDHCYSGTLGAFHQAAQVVGIPNPIPGDFGGVADWRFAQTVWAIKKGIWQVRMVKRFRVLSAFCSWCQQVLQDPLN
ncbi:hypothetical protein DUI87_30390 [Hirundo rustica rustica]|uniref:Retroviral nucleocapsid Gag protein p24 C-terminal domain-containing protein n=1 Tax=Hirundo rustica rustica TaxID=333673 RepID=A0A3M0IXN8_HIRRU|nr:hypothetical protein DUI87_30390 [Hirundo rustica rustica]